jgi:putative endonuclease
LKHPAIYILTNRIHQVLYIGVTSNLTQRVYQHKKHEIEGFTRRYNVDKLVYFEQHESMIEAIQRKRL